MSEDRQSWWASLRMKLSARSVPEPAPQEPYIGPLHGPIGPPIRDTTGARAEPEIIERMRREAIRRDQGGPYRLPDEG